MAHPPPKQRISAHDLADQLAEQRVKVIDVREPMEYAGGPISGSLNVPLARITQADLPRGPLVLVCHSGNRSAQALAQLQQLGQAQPLADLEGGVPAWQQAGLPLRKLKNAPLPLMRQVQIVAGLDPAQLVRGRRPCVRRGERLLRHGPPARPDALEQGEPLMALGTLALLAGGGGLIGFLLSVLRAGGSILLLPLKEDQRLNDHAFPNEGDLLSTCGSIARATSTAMDRPQAAAGRRSCVATNAAPPAASTTPPLTARNTSIWSSSRAIPRAEPATICTLALISSVSSSKTVALRASTLAVVNGQKGLRSTVRCQIPPHAGDLTIVPRLPLRVRMTICHRQLAIKKTPAEAGALM